MEAYANALNFAIPFFILLMLIEFIASKIMKRSEVINSMDTLASLSSGLTNVIKDVLKLIIPIILYGWLVDKIALFEINSFWIAFVVTFVFKDFIGYWVHRLEHRVNYFWNRHIIHHSSEEFNLACALRQSISEFTTITTVLLIPLALIGVSFEVYATVAAIHLFAQFWYHTRLINRMGFLEHIIVTPSHHRVHHAINDEYLDKNFGQIFIVWDKWFGTFQEELPEKEPVYGVKRAVKTYNPVLINFKHLWLIIKDCWRTESWKDKMKVWFMPTGWRPKDMEENYPVESIGDVYQQEKYAPKLSIYLKVWSWFQLIVSFSMMIFLFNQIGNIGVPKIYLLGLFIIFSIFSFTLLMDKNRLALSVETIRAIVGFVLIYSFDGWFTLEQFIPISTMFLQVYFIVSLIATFVFTKYESHNSIQSVQQIS